MSDSEKVLSYHEMMVEANSTPLTKAQTPENYFSVLPVKIGALSGLIGAVAIMIIIGLLTIPASMQTYFAPRFIASTILGEAAWAGTFPIVLGTIIHLLAGAAFGAIFAYVIPRLPRAFWFVAGIIFGMIIWAVAAITLPLLAETDAMNASLYTNALIISHIIFGITLGVAGSLFGINESE